MAAGPAAGDQLTVTIGPIPQEILDGVRAFSAHAIFLMNSMFGDQYRAKSAPECQSIIEALMGEQEDLEKKVRGGFPMWISLEVARPVCLLADPTAEFRWLRDKSITADVLKTFAADANDFLDVATAWILPVLGDNLRPDRVTLGRRRTYIVGEGRQALGLPDLSASGSGYAVTSGWSKLPLSDLLAALESSPRAGTPGWELVRTAARWLTAALLEEEDVLRRFQFAFFGLEVLANKVGKRVEDSVIADLTAEVGLPVRHLVWPAPSDDGSPSRNITFRFAVMAVRVARHNADADIAQFRELAKERNRLSHGSVTDDGIENLPADQAIELLRHYLQLVTGAAAAGSLT